MKWNWGFLGVQRVARWRVLSEADPNAFGVGATVLGELTPRPIEDKEVGGEFLLRAEGG